VPDRLVTDVFSSPVVPILGDLETRGVPVVLTAGRIQVGAGITDDERDVLRAHEQDLRALIGVIDDGVWQRRETFEVEAARQPGTTSYLYRKHIPLVRGTCFSCGERLPAMEFARCWRCRLAWRLAQRQPILSAEWAAAVDTARAAG
jgi:hypothetical protein